MDHAQDRDGVASRAIENDVRCASDDELPDAGDRPRAAEMRMLAKRLHDRYDPHRQPRSRLRLIERHVAPDLGELCARVTGPDDVWAHVHSVFVAATARAFRQRQLFPRTPGKKPRFHVFVPNVVARLDILVRLT